MADDQSQRPHRASEPPVRNQAKASGNDPLAELARLIGQTDPFGEYGRAVGHATSPQPTEYSDWDSQPARSPYAEQKNLDRRQTLGTQRFGENGSYTGRSASVEQQLDELQSDGGQNYERQPYSGAPVLSDDDFYTAHHEARGYPADQAAYQNDPYEQDAVQYVDEEYYEDVPPPRRRMGIVAIASVLALAVVGTAGAFGYRALFGSSSSQPPPVIKADTGPSKIVPGTFGKDTQSNKLITDRMEERAQSEKMVSREEQPIDKPATVVLSQAVQQSAMGSGVVGSEPKKVRTIAIRPDQPVVADAMPQAAPPVAAAASARPQAPTAKSAVPAARPAADNSTTDADTDSNSPAVARSVLPARQAAQAPSNTPLPLAPDAGPARAPGRSAPAPTQTAAVTSQSPAPAPGTNNAVGGGSFVQVSSQRSESEAQAAFRSLQAKYPDLLGGREMLIHKVDLGAKGTYYRAMVGPFANASEASELCSSLKAAGGQCLIQRN